MPNNTAAERKLDKMEQWFIAKGLAILSAATVQSPISLNQEFVSQAAQVITKKHQALHASYYLHEESGELRWRIEPEIRNQAIVETHQLLTAKEWESMLEKMMNDPSISPSLKEGNASWKVIILNFDDKPEIQKIVIIANHAIIDGMSTYVLLNDLLTWTHLLSSGSITLQQALESTATIPMAPHTLEALLPAHKRTPEDIQQAEELAASEEEPSFHIPTDYHEGDEMRPKPLAAAITAHGTKEGLKRLTSFCKKHGFTVGNVMAAALVQAASVLAFERQDYEQIESIDMDTSISANVRTRSAVAMPADIVALLAGEIAPRVSISRTTPFLQLCKSMQQEMHIKLHLEKEYVYGTLAFELAEEDEEKVATGEEEDQDLDHMGDLEFNNLGRYPFPSQQGPFVIKDICTTTTSCSSCYSIAVITTSVEHASHCILYSKALMKKATMERVTEMFMSLLELPSESTTCELLINNHSCATKRPASSQ